MRLIILTVLISLLSVSQSLAQLPIEKSHIENTDEVFKILTSEHLELDNPNCFKELYFHSFGQNPDYQTELSALVSMGCKIESLDFWRTRDPEKNLATINLNVRCPDTKLVLVPAHGKGASCFYKAN